MSEKLEVKIGMSTLDKPMTREAAMRWGIRHMPKDLKRAGFTCFVGRCDLYPDLGPWFRINYGRKF